MRPPPSFIHASQASPSSPQTGPGRVHELKHDGYRLQIHVRDGRGLFNDTESRGGSQADMDCKLIRYAKSTDAAHGCPALLNGEETAIGGTASLTRILGAPSDRKSVV